MMSVLPAMAASGKPRRSAPASAMAPPHVLMTIGTKPYSGCPASSTNTYAGCDAWQSWWLRDGLPADEFIHEGLCPKKSFNGIILNNSERDYAWGTNVVLEI
jgi:hypothetical protein